MGGLSIGVFWGTLVSAVGLAALSLSSPLPPRGDDTGQAGAADAPAAVVEEIATAPESEEAEAEAPAAEPEVAPEPLAEEASEAMSEAGPEAAPEPAPEAASQVAPTQESAPATEVPLPSGSEFNRPPPEPEAALPAPDVAPASTAPQAPAMASDGAAPSLDTAPAAQPAVDAVAPAAITAEATDAEAPASPASAPAPSVASGPAALSEPATSETPQVSTALLPQVADAEPEAPDTPRLPTVGEPEQPEEDAEQEVAASTLPTVSGGSGLPTVAPLIAPVEPEVEAEAEAEAETEEVIADLPAIQAFATPFDEAETRPLMAVVLIDEPGSRIDLETLTRFSFPVAFAIDPLHPEAAARAAAYRAAGFEVVVLGSMIAEGATAVDTEVALAAALQTLPEAVAVIDTPEGRIQGDRPVLDATVGALAESGHGLLAFPRGLNAAEQTASRAGVPGATVFRFLDGEDQRATVITRFLSRAAFAAAQEGTVIVVGRTRPDTVTALFSWALGGRTEAVALAPLSATMMRAAE
ncbi:divergent polysaccharide deacetylase family protein [Rhodobacteraceae bacterium M385]|nr:divergent polysaccharide deacetylase family protein [Rhodobacteraceae bacterium M385]